MKTGTVIGVVAVVALLGTGIWYSKSAQKKSESGFYNLQLGNLQLESEINRENTNNMNPTTEEKKEYEENATVVLHTNRGDIEIELFLKETPITAGNFLDLAESGFYNDVKFHRVIEGFMIQGGDPNSKTDNVATYGTGGPGYVIEDEFAPGLTNVVGTISMANAGPGTGGSQFFINTNDNLFLDGKHAVFGRVISGMDVVREIEATETGMNDLPVSPVVIESVEVKSAE